LYFFQIAFRPVVPVVKILGKISQAGAASAEKDQAKKGQDEKFLRFHDATLDVD
jgi:hypothetical protein